MFGVYLFEEFRVFDVWINDIYRMFFFKVIGIEFINLILGIMKLEVNG